MRFNSDSCRSVEQRHMISTYLQRYLYPLKQSIIRVDDVIVQVKQAFTNDSPASPETHHPPLTVLLLYITICLPQRAKKGSSAS